MSCDRTEYRLLLHAHGALGWWERLQMERHLRTCPCCRQQFQRFGVERRALASCLVTPPMSRVSDRVATGQVFVPFHFREAAANLLTNPILDPYAKMAELKICAVRIEPVRVPAPV